MGLDNSTTDPSRDTVTVTNPNSSCSLWNSRDEPHQSRDEPHLPPPSLGKTVLLVWALGTWAVTLDGAPGLGLSTDTLWVDGEVGPHTARPDTRKPTGSGLCRSLGRSSASKFELTPLPAHPQPGLMPVCSPTVKTRNSEPQFQPDRLQEGSRPLDPCEKCLLVSNPGFTLMLFSAKELKNHVIYTYTSVSIENVCTSGEMALPARWGLLS